MKSNLNRNGLIALGMLLVAILASAYLGHAEIAERLLYVAMGGAALPAAVKSIK